MKNTIIILGFGSFMLGLFGCSDQSKSDKEPLSEETHSELNESIEAFQNRTIYAVLTEEIIDGTSDDDLLQVVFDNLCEKLPSDYKNEYRTVMSWNKSMQAIYTIWCLEAEVNNGGFNQFYFNSSGAFFEVLPKSLSLVKASRFAELCERANQIFLENKSRLEEFDDGSLESFSDSYIDNPLNEIDEEFFELYRAEDLWQLQVDFIRKNKSDFIGE